MKKELVGVDLFMHWRGTNPDELAAMVKGIMSEEVNLTMITNRGIKVYPDGFSETFCTDHWRCRFKPKNNISITRNVIIDLMQKALINNLDVIKTENLYAFDGKPAFSLGQGQ
jgi:isocitrate dehydrogenase